MSYLIQPSACPRCQEPLELTYAQRRYARLQPLARLMLALILLACLFLVPLLFLVSRDFVAWFTEELALHRRERGMLFLIVYALTLTALGFLARWGWRRTLMASRRTQVECQACGWSGPCAVQQMWL